MLTDRKPLLKALRRSHSSSSPSSSSSLSSSSSSSSSPWINLRSALLVAAFLSSSSSSSSSPVSITRRGHKSPWSLRRSKHALLPKQWKSFFTDDGRLCDGGLKFLKKARSGGIDPSIRAEVWPFLLGIYDVNSSEEERDVARGQMRKEYENLRKQCRHILKCADKSYKSMENNGTSCNNNSDEFSKVTDFPDLDEFFNSTRQSVSAKCDISPELSNNHSRTFHRSESISEKDIDKTVLACEDSLLGDLFTSDSESSDDPETMEPFIDIIEGNDIYIPKPETSTNSITESATDPKSYVVEDFATWQRIMRLDAVRANPDWIMYSPSQASVSELKARRLAGYVGLKDYDHLEPCRIYHAARLVAILEAYALYDPETGYCQGMSDLLSPIIAVMEDDSDAFWCFVSFMKKARYNFRLDEVGIRRQLGIISKIIKCKDINLYRHLEKLEAEDCFFVYRMVVVLFRRELNLEQTLCLWEVMWADQAAILAGISRSVWGRMRLRAPPSDDLLLYAIAACVLQRRKLIVEKYSSVDEIMKDCNNMAGQLDVWKLLDDAHDLVVTLHDKI